MTLSLAMDLPKVTSRNGIHYIRIIELAHQYISHNVYIYGLIDNLNTHQSATSHFMLLGHQCTRSPPMFYNKTKTTSNLYTTHLSSAYHS